MDWLKKAQEAADLISRGRAALTEIADAVSDGRVALGEQDRQKLQDMLDKEEEETRAAKQRLDNAIATARR